MKRRFFKKSNQVQGFTHGTQVSASARRAKTWRTLSVCAAFALTVFASVVGFVGFGGNSSLSNPSSDTSNVAYAADSYNGSVYNDMDTGDQKTKKYQTLAAKYSDSSLAAAWRTAVDNNGTFNLTQDWVATPMAMNMQPYMYNVVTNTGAFTTEFGRDIKTDLDGYETFANDKHTSTDAAFYNEYSLSGSYYLNTTQSGALFVPAGKKVTINLNGHKIDKNLSNAPTAIGAGGKITAGGLGISKTKGFVIMVAGELIINGGDGGTICGGWSTNDYGSAIHMLGGAKLTATNVTFSNNGGGTPIYSEGVNDSNRNSITLTNCTFKDNIAYTLNKETNVATPKTMTYNFTYTDTAGTAQTYAASNVSMLSQNGGIYAASYTDVNLSGCSFLNNCATWQTGDYWSNAGAMRISETSTIDMVNTIISNNYGTIGAIYIAGTFSKRNTLNIDDASIKITNNIGTGRSGAIFVNQCTDVTYSAGTVSGNISTSGWGGAFQIEDGSILTMSNGVKITDCKSYAGSTPGGAITVWGGTRYGRAVLNFNDATISNCTGQAGAIWLHDYADLNLTKGVIENNLSIAGDSCTRVGGVYAGNSSTITMEDGAEIRKNKGFVGGVSLYNTATFNFNGGKITGNTSTSTVDSSHAVGGLLDYYSSKVTMSGNAEISNNRGYVGGVTVDYSALLTMDGGKIEQNVTSAPNRDIDVNVGGVYITNTGVPKFVMNGGSVSYNTGRVGGVRNEEEFYMHGGTIACNIADRYYSGRASGIYSVGGVYNADRFYMTGGKITGNKYQASSAFKTDEGEMYGNGGVCNVNTFHMAGGEISGNVGLGTICGTGGLANFDSAATYLYGGKITNNIGRVSGGIFKGGSSALWVGGNVLLDGTTYGDGAPVVANNYVVDETDPDAITSTTPKKSNNIDLYYGRSSDYANYEYRSIWTLRTNLIGVGGALTTGAMLYVTKYPDNYRTDAYGTITSGYGTYNTAEPSTYFFADDTTNLKLNAIKKVNAANVTEASLFCINNAQNWSDAVRASSDADPKTIQLYSNWTATDYTGTNTHYASKKRIFRGFYYNNIDGFTTYGALSVPSGNNVILDLNNFTIDRDLSAGDYTDGNGFVINNAGTLVIDDTSVDKNGTITGGYNVMANGNGLGGGIFSAAAVTAGVTLKAGKIVGNHANYGGGVACYQGAFTMLGGEISDNYAEAVDPAADASAHKHSGTGGGVWLYNNYNANSKAELVSGTIKDNHAKRGGGVGTHCYDISYIDRIELYIISKITITDNDATEMGGGVYIKDLKTYFGMSGAPVITNNTVNSKAHDIYLPSTFVGNTANVDNGIITILGKLTGSSSNKIGIYRDIGYTFTSNFKAKNPSASPSNFFKAQKENYSVSTDAYGEGELISKKGNENWFSAVTMSVQLGKQYTVTLQENWTGVTNDTANFGKSLYGDASKDTFTATNQPYYYGAMNVPSAANIILDLNGFTIDRGFGSAGGGSPYGWVIGVGGGKLTIQDSSEGGNGKIKGGWAASNGATYTGGGIHVYGANSRLRINGGNITENRSTGIYNSTTPYGVGGVAMAEATSQFTMTGGAIYKNLGSFAGGVGFHTLKQNTFMISGRLKICDNTAGMGIETIGEGEPNDVHNPGATSGTTEAHSKDTANYKITIIGKFVDGAKICISRPDVNNAALANTNGNIFTSSYAAFNKDGSKIVDPTKYFFPSDAKKSQIRSYTPQSGGMEVTIWNVDMTSNWNNAIAANRPVTDSPITITLYHDWTADKNGRMGTGTGFDTASGSIVMPYSNVILDLNGYTIDRGLYDNDLGSTNGYVFNLTGACRLEIIDSSDGKTGKITGGNNTTANQAGGINVAHTSASLILNGGTITKNKGVDGGVATYTDTTFKTGSYFAMGDSALVTGNIDRWDSDLNINLRAKYTQKIIILSKLTKGGEDGLKSGITKDSSSDFTESFLVYHPEENPDDYFVADNGTNYVIKATSGEAALYTMDNYSNWKFAVSESIATGYEMTVKLVSDWNASGGEFWQGNSDNVAFSYGALFVPTNAKIILDLNGYKLNRNLDHPEDYGYVVFIQGKFTLMDSYTGKDRYGAITGGNNGLQSDVYAYYCGAGINVQGAAGRFYLNSGVIEGNHSRTRSDYSTGGVYVDGSAKAYLNGGEIRENYGAFTGGVNVYTNASIYIGGTVKIHDNYLSNSQPMDVRPRDDNAAYKLQISTKFEKGADIAISYIGNNYAADLKSNIFTQGFEGLNPGVKTSSVFRYSNPLLYKIVDMPSSGSTGIEAALECIDNEQNWRQACAASAASKGAVRRTVTLSRDWVAYNDEMLGTAFGTDTTYYSMGALNLSKDCNILLDLNGYTIDRNLTAARAGGLVINVLGKLEITDSSAEKTGKITGGRNTSDTDSSAPGAINFTLGELRLSGGTITGNEGKTAGGIGIAFASSAAAPLYMGGSALVTGNRNTATNSDSDIVGTSPVQMIEITSPLSADGKTGFIRPGVGDFTTKFTLHMGKADPAKYFTSTLPMYVYKYDTGEAGLYTNDNKMNWEYAVKASIAGNKKQIIFKLVSDWTAENNGAFGTDSTAFVADLTAQNNGALYVPAQADIVVDLNGFTLDRHLEGAIEYGYIFRIYGNLTVRDTSDGGNGVITGGYNSYNSTQYAAQSSVFYVYSGASLKIEGGNITGNRATGAYSSVITACYANTITISGGKISGNYGGDHNSENGAGAILLMVDKAVNISGSPQIIDNKHNHQYDCDIRQHNAGYLLQIVGSFTSKAKIGVAPNTQVNNYTSATGGQQFTYNYFSHHTSADYPDRYFVGRWLQSHSIEKITTVNGAEAAFWCTENYTNWINAVSASATNKPVRFELSEDWVAEYHGTYTTSFHPTLYQTYYDLGAINLPAGKSIILDLKGYTINRDLSADSSCAVGSVINVSGVLEIIDTSTTHTGKIVGGFNRTGGGGIVVKSGGTLTLNGGTITNNVGASVGGGVYVANGGKIAIGGRAQIYENINIDGISTNLYLDNSKELITISSDLLGKEKIGITRNGNGYVTTGFSEHMSGYSPLDYFFSENDQYYGIESGDNELFFLSPNNDENWKYAVNASLENKGKTQTVRLTGDWLASETTSSTTYKTEFGTDNNAYRYGALYVPVGASVELDLAGHTISRNLTAPSRFGNVISVLGTLTIVDTSDDGTGKISGGRLNQADTYVYSAGVHVAGKGKFSLLGGSITGNTEIANGNVSSAVYVQSGATFVLKDASVTANSSDNAAIYIESGAIFTVGGKAVAKDNLSGENPGKDTVMANYTGVINIDSKLTTGASIGFYREVNNYRTESFGGSIFTSGFYRYNTDSPTKYFVPSDSRYEVIEYKLGAIREACLFCKDNTLNWINATNTSYNTRTEMTVTLYDNWSATRPDTGVVTSFGTDGIAFTNGALYVRDGVQIILDLNNYKLDRDLQAQSTNNTGYVIYVGGSGKLTVTDSSLGGAGTITGGYNTGDNIDAANYGSGIHVCSGGKFIMTGGNIEGNRGVGLYLAGNNLFQLGGKSSVINNTFKGGANANIYLNQDTQLITIISELDKTSEFGIRRTKGSTNFGAGAITADYGKYNKKIEPSEHFTSDDDRYNVVDEGFFEDDSKEGALLGKDNYTNWAYAVKTSIKNGGRAQVCTLYSDWTAETYKDYKTSFTQDHTINGFLYGALYVPTNCHIILDLNGYTIDRALFDAQASGSVMYVRGTLEIRDSSDGETGKITGGYTNGTNGGHWSYYYNGHAGGISVYDGTLVIEGGTITGNKNTYAGSEAGAIWLSGGATFTMTGGKITENYGVFAGGVYAYSTAVVNIGGSAYISGNKLMTAAGAPLETNSNIYFSSSTNVVGICNIMNSDASVGISVDPNSIPADGRFITSNWQVHNADKDVTKYFFSDNTSKAILEDSKTDEKHEGLLICRDSKVNWQKVVQASISEKTQKTFTLYDNWTATRSGSVTSFGSGTGYYNGALRVPSNADIVLDLNGKTLDRAMFGDSSYYSYGWVIYVEGKLTVIDSSAKVDKSGNIVQGKITGGYVHDGAAIHQDYYGTVDIQAGLITRNKVVGDYGGALFVYTNRVTIGGTVQFAENYRVQGSSSLIKEDIGFRYNDGLVKIGSEMVAGADTTKQDIYVRKSAMGAITSGWGEYNALSPETRFKAADSARRVGTTGAGKSREGVLLSNSNTDNWTFAINSSKASNSTEYFKLVSDWTATNYAAGSYNTRFGTDSGSYRNGALYVPSNASIVLDLNGFTLDRAHALNLDTKYPAYNMTIFVEGQLQIIDTSTMKTGVLKGGSYGVYVSGTKATLCVGGMVKTGDTVVSSNTVNVYGEAYGGKITGNSLYGVYVNSGTFTATDGQITGNSTADAFIGKTDTVVNVGEKAYIYTENRKAGASLRLENVLAKINIISTLSDDARIGYVRHGVGPLTNGWGKFNGNESDPFEHVFVSEESEKYTPYTDTVDSYTEICVSSYDNAINWQFIVDKSLTTGEQQEFILYSCWTAAEHETYKTAFGTGTAYRNGALYVPEGAKVTLNLFGHKLDRALKDATQNGLVIFVDGELTIIDDQSVDSYDAGCCDLVDGARPAGEIKGGANSTGSSAGGIYISKTGVVTMNGGVIKGNKETNESSSAGAVYVAGKFVMDNGTISDNDGFGAGAVYVSSSGTFEMNGGLLSANTAQSGGGAVYVTGKFNFNDGAIDANTGLIGAVYVASGGQMVMDGDAEGASGATITNNTGSSAGAVFVNNGTDTFFKMLGGKIANNTAVSAGGVYSAGVVEMSGGLITENKATGTTINDGGGAMYVSGTANVTVTGGTITKNIGENGIRVHSSGIIGVGGTAKIYENEATNTTNAGGQEVESNPYCDIYLTATSRKIDVVSELQTGAKIGVYRLNSGLFTNGYGKFNTANPQNYFVSNRSIYSISLSVADDVLDREATIGIPVDPQPAACAKPYEYNGDWQNIIVDIDTTMVTIGSYDPAILRVHKDGGKTYIQAVNAGSYSVAFTVNDTYCWADGTITEKVIVGTIAPKVVALDWTDELHDGAACVYDGTTTHTPTATVQDASLCTNVLTTEKDTCEVTVAGGQINASPVGGHTATAVGLSNPNYKLGTTDIDHKFIVEKAERPAFAITSYQAFYKTPTKMQVEGNLENGAVTYSVAESYATVNNDTGELTINKYTKATDTFVTLTAVAAETTNYKASTATKQIKCVPGELKTTIIPTEVTYGDTVPLELAGYDASEMGKVTWSIINIEGDSGRATLTDGKIYATNVGTVRVTAKVEASAFYKASTITGNITITKRLITIDWGDSLTVSYNGEEQTLAAPSYEGVLKNDTMFRLNVYKAGYAGWAEAQAAPTWTDAGEYDVGLVLSNSNYTLGDEENYFHIFEIQKALLTLKFTSDEAYYATPFYPEVEGNNGDGKLTITFTGCSAGLVDYINYNPGDQLYTVYGLGTMEFRADVAETANYAGASIIGTYKIVHAKLPIVVSPERVTYGSKKVQLTATYENADGKKIDITDKVTFELLDTAYEEFVDFAVEDGKYYINAKKVGNIKVSVATSEIIGSYQATTVEAEIIILPITTSPAPVDPDPGPDGPASTPKPDPTPGILEFDWTYDESYVYDGTAKTATATVVAGSLLSGDTCNVIGYEVYANDGATLVPDGAINAGTYRIKPLLDNPNYEASVANYGTITIKPRQVIVAWSVGAYTYNAKEQAPTATVANIVEGDTCNFTVMGATSAGDGLTATITGLDNSNYTIDGSENLTTTFNIKPYEITIEWGETSLVYNGKQQAPEATVTGMFGDDECAAIISGYEINVNPDEKPYKATVTGVSNPNYTVGDKQPTIEFNITRATLTITFKETTIVYGETMVLEVLGNDVGAKVKYQLGEGAANATLGAGNVFKPTNVGQVEVIATIEATENFAKAVVEQIITITPRPISVSWSDTTFTYDGEEHNATAEVINLVYGDVVVITLSTGKVDAGSYIAEVVGLDNAKYTIDGGENITQSFEIAKRVLTVTWSTEEFTYNGSEQSPTATLGNLVGDDECTPTVQGQIDAGVNVEAKIVSVSNGNYTVDGCPNASTRFTILPKLVLIEWSNTDLTYNGTEQGPEAKVINLVEGDECDVTVSGWMINVGTYEANASKLSNSNYTLTYDPEKVEEADRPITTQEYTIKKADIKVDLPNNEVTYGSELLLALDNNDGDGTVEYTVADGTGSATISGTTLKPVKVGTVTVTATVAATENHNGTTATFEVVITPLAIEVEWTQEGDFTYNGEVQTPTPKITNLIGDDECTITKINGDSDAGYGRVATIVEISNPNYTVDGGKNISKVYEILARPLTGVTWEEDRKYSYNGKKQGPSATAEGLIDGDKCEIIVDGWKTSVGTYTATATGVNNSNYTLDGVTGLTAEFEILVSKPELKIETKEVILGKSVQIKISGNVGDGDVTYEIVNGSEFGTLSGDTLTGKLLGTITIRVSVGSTGNTEAATVEGDIKVIKGAAPLKLKKTEVTYGSTLKLELDDASGSLTPEMYNNLTYTILPIYDGKVASIEGDVITTLSAGEFMLNISVDESDYFDATDVTVAISIKPRIVVLEWTVGTYTYNAQEQSPTAKVTNLVEGDDCEVVVSTGKNAGDYTSRVESLSNKNYTFEKAENITQAFTIKPCLITLEWGSDQLYYNGEEQVPEVTLVGLYDGDECELVYNVTEGEHKLVGDYTLVTSGLSNENYYLESDTTLGYRINPADIKPSISPKQIVYGETEELTLEGNYDGAAYTLEVDKHNSVGLGTLTLEEGKYKFTATRVGKVIIKVVVEASDNCNAYTGELEIEVVKAEREVAITTLTGRYGDSLTLEITGNEDDPGNPIFIVDNDEMASISGNVLTPKHAGTVSVTVRVSETACYKDDVYTTVQITIEPRIVEISWKNTEFIYNGEVQAPEAEITNLIEGDVCKFTVVGGEINAGTYTSARVTNLTNSDYTLVGCVNTGTVFTIGKKSLDLSILTERINIGVPATLKIKGNDGEAPITYSIKNQTGEATVDSDGIITPVKMGTIIVTISVPESQNYLADTCSKLIIVDRSALNLTMENTTVQYGKELLLEVGGNVEGSDILFTVINDTGAAEVVGSNVLKPTRAGKVIVKVNIAETVNFAATEKEFEITITPIKVELSWGNLEFTYNGKDMFAPTAKIISGLLSGESCEVIVAGGQMNAGEYDTAYAAGLTNPNYTLEGANTKAPKFVINKADPIIVFKTTAVTINVPTKIEVEGNMEFGNIIFSLGTVGPEVEPKGEGTISGSTLTGTKLGYVHVVATVMATDNYNGGSVEADILVEKPEAPVDLEVKEVVYGSAIELSVIIDTEEISSYTLSVERIEGNNGDATLDGHTLLGKAAGEVYVIITTEETETYKASNKKIKVTVKPLVVEVSWSDLTFDYDGTEKKPTATISNRIGSDTFKLEVSGQKNAGTDLVATLTATGNPNYTVEGSATATTKFTINPRVVTIAWDTETILTYNGKEQAPKATVTNAIEGDVVNATVSGGKDAGTNTATVTALDNPNYTLDGADVTTDYAIKAYSVYIKWGELNLIYNGKKQAPTATALGTLDGDVVTATVTGAEKDAKDSSYNATIVALDNKNYTAIGADDDAPEGAGALKTEFYIKPAKLTFKTAKFSVPYNGTAQNPVLDIEYKNETDNLILAFEGGNKTNAGEYPITLKITGGDSMGNYYIGEDDASKTFTILKKKVNVKVSTVNKTADYTGMAVTITDWHTLTCTEFVGAEASKTVAEVFAMNTLKLTPKFKNEEGNFLTSVGLRGKYGIYADLDEGKVSGSLTGSENYEAVLVVDNDNVGTLTISGGDALKLAETSTFDFLYLEETTGKYSEIYRKTYTQMNYTHGKDDTKFDRVVLGNIPAGTSVGTFLNNIDSDQLATLRIYNNKSELIYSCGKPADGISESDLYDASMYAIGTGWKVLYGKEEAMADTVYISVLGDLDGDGAVTAVDVAYIGDYIKEVENLSDLERKLAAMIRNKGMINAADISSMGLIIRGQKASADFF